MKRILIADDSRIFRMALGRTLSSQYEIAGYATDGNQAQEAFSQHNPDVLLLDITMPNCDGRECLEKIMNQNETAKIIMISAIEDKETMEECLSLGAKAFINKGNIDFSSEDDIQNLVKTIESVLKNNAQGVN